MTVGAAQQSYSLRDVQSMLGISRAVIARLIAAGFVTPGRGRRREYRFGFQDVVLLRTACSLQAADIPARRILRSLQRLKATLPSELPMTGLRITAIGNEIAVRQGDMQWHVDSGQLLMDFELQPARGSVRLLVRPSPVASETPAECYQRGVELEATSRPDAEAAYRRTIEQAPDHVDAYLNLGVMLSDAGRGAEALALYDQALAHCPDAALLHFNRAVALEDLQRPHDALAAYEACLRFAPAFADAHYNAARLHELMGHARKAIRHYSEYRRLQR